MTSNNTTALSKEPCLFDLSINTNIYANNAVVAALHISFAIFAMISNVVVMLTVIKTESLHRPPNILLSSLAFGDFLVGAVAQPLLAALHMMHNAGVNCSLYTKMYNTYIHRRVIPIIVCGSFLQVCVMCWDRFKAVSSPMNYRTTVTNKKMTKIAVTSWVAWVTYLVSLQLIPDRVRRLFAVSTLASFIIICVVSQIATLKAIRRQNNKIAAAANIDTFAREKKMAVTLRWILGSVVISVLPQLVFGISIIALGTNQSRGQVFLSPWVKLAMCLSSSFNPVIYFWRHENMHSAALRLIGR